MVMFKGMVEERAYWERWYAALAPPAPAPTIATLFAALGSVFAEETRGSKKVWWWDANVAERNAGRMRSEESGRMVECLVRMESSVCVKVETVGVDDEDGAGGWIVASGVNEAFGK